MSDAQPANGQTTLSVRNITDLLNVDRSYAYKWLRRGYIRPIPGTNPRRFSLPAVLGACIGLDLQRRGASWQLAFQVSAALSRYSFEQLKDAFDAGKKYMLCAGHKVSSFGLISGDALRSLEVDITSANCVGTPVVVLDVLAAYGDFAVKIAEIRAQHEAEGVTA